MHYFCTLFDKNYLFQGIALYRSLQRTTGEFNLYVLCMDQVTYEFIRKINAPALIPIHLSEIENKETRAVKEHTSHGQFCWVSQPLVCTYVLEKFTVDIITYLEADSMFFGDPSSLFEELAGYSVSVVPHRYTPRFDQTTISGKYCVQFNAFRNDPEAHEVLNYWKECCFKYTKDKPLYLPGQLCLDQWPEKFKCVKEIQNIGAGVAPWNVQQYAVSRSRDGVFVNGLPLIFYHYHQFCRYEDGSYELGSYPLTRDVIQHIYLPYMEALDAAEVWVKSIDFAFVYRKEIKKPKTLKELLRAPRPADIRPFLSDLLRKMKGTYNVYPADYFSDHKLK